MKVEITVVLEVIAKDDAEARERVVAAFDNLDFEMLSIDVDSVEEE